MSKDSMMNRMMDKIIHDLGSAIVDNEQIDPTTIVTVGDLKCVWRGDWINIWRNDELQAQISVKDLHGKHRRFLENSKALWFHLTPVPVLDIGGEA